jgi:general secretion pathway protein L
VRLELDAALDRVYTAVNWWLEGLWLGLPPHMRKALFAERAEVIARMARNSVTVGPSNGEAVTIDTRAADAEARIEQLVPDARVIDVTVVLPRGSVLTHRLRVPAAAEAELHNALKHELDRLTPFAIDEIAFDYRVRERMGTALLVDVALTRRAALEEAIAGLERIGLRPATATAEDAHGEPLALNLLPRRRQLRLPAAAPSFRPRLALCAALLALSALYLPLSRYDNVLAAHGTVVEATRTEAVAARERLADEERALASGELLAERRRGYAPPVELLRELTEQMPDHTWVSRLAMTRGEVHLQGESAAATELLQRLESTDLFHDVQFQSPVSRGDESGKEQFTIVARLAGSAP